jgi:hypothetical protein
MDNNTNTVTLIIDKSPIRKWLPGKLVKWNIQSDDLVPGIGKVTIKVIVVLGNNQYYNGQRVTLFLDPSLPVT